MALMKTACPPETPLTFGCSVEFVAVDPTTGADVAGVLISNASIYLTGATVSDAVSVGPFMLVPGPGA